MDKKIGDYLYTAIARFESVTTWEIVEVTENQYRCKDAESDEFRYFSKNDVVIFDTKEEARQAISDSKKKENLKLLFLTLPIVIIVAIVAIAAILA